MSVQIEKQGLVLTLVLSRPHHAITELAESLASEQTIMSIAGHVSPRMLAHYSHVRLEAKRRAVEALSSRAATPAAPNSQPQADASPGRGLGGSYVTNDGALEIPEGVRHPEVLEKGGGPHGIRTHDLRVANAALSQLS